MAYLLSDWKNNWVYISWIKFSKQYFAKSNKLPWNLLFYNMVWYNESSYLFYLAMVFCLQFVDFLQWQSVVETFDYLYILIIFWLTYQTITALAQTLPCLDKDFAIFSCLYKKLGCLCFAGYGVAKKLKTRLYRRAKSWFTRRIVYV